jgi:hypothetical protein
VTAAAHRHRVRADLAHALARLDPPQRAAIQAHAEGGAARAAGLPRSTYYRVLAHAQARMSGDLRGRLTGLGALGGVMQRARELFQHVEAAHAAAAAATAAVAVSAAVVLGAPDERAHPLASPASVIAVVANGGRAAAASVPVVPSAPVRARPQPPTAAPPTPATTVRRVSAAASSAVPATCTYDPSTYDC